LLLLPQKFEKKIQIIKLAHTSFSFGLLVLLVATMLQMKLCNAFEQPDSIQYIALQPVYYETVNIPATQKQQV
jgi:hypothetical protein